MLTIDSGPDEYVQKLLDWSNAYLDRFNRWRPEMVPWFKPALFEWRPIPFLQGVRVIRAVMLSGKSPETMKNFRQFLGRVALVNLSHVRWEQQKATDASLIRGWLRADHTTAISFVTFFKMTQFPAPLFVG